ncbi:MAG: hypothetical protein V4659_06640 [Pseudomonadota bacterium]
MTTDKIDRATTPWRWLGWGGAAALLSVPWFAGFPWTLSDYVVMGVLFGIVGLLFELATRISRNRWYRAGAAVTVAGVFLLIWVNLAVGFLGDEDNRANLIFFGVLAVAFVGGALGRFRAGAMARAMTLTAAVQVAVGAGAWTAGWALPGYDGVYEVLLGTTMFTGLWLVAAGFFLRAADG